MAKTTHTLTQTGGFTDYITPSDSGTIADDPANASGYTAVGLKLEEDGVVHVTYSDGNEQTCMFFKGMNPVSVTKVWATGTTATNIVATYTE